MVGNDIVDLHLADRNAWKQERFLNKVLNPSEQEFLLESEDPGLLLWVFWSMKESAYKLEFRKSFRRALNPTHYRCSLESSSAKRIKGIVEVNESVYRLESVVTCDYVHTLAKLNGSDSLWLQGEVSAADGPEVRRKTIEALLKDYSFAIGMGPEEVQFDKDENNLPFLTHELTGAGRPCSISHHGKYGAYAIAV